MMNNYFDKSEQITEGLRKSFQSVDCKMANRSCYGYTTLVNGEFAINETEAAVVQWMFGRYLVGYSFGKIAIGLEKQHVLSPTGKAKWNREAISKLLSNEKYAGAVLLQKTYVEDFFTGKQKKNVGQRERYYYKNNHEAIMSLEIFERVQDT